MDGCVKKVFYPEYWTNVRPKAEREILMQYDDKAVMIGVGVVSMIALAI